MTKRRKRRPKQQDVRKVVRARLKELGKTPYWLFTHAGVKGMSAMTVKRFIYGMNDIGSDKLGPIMSAVGLRITADPDFKIKE